MGVPKSRGSKKRGAILDKYRMYEWQSSWPIGAQHVVFHTWHQSACTDHCFTIFT
ncbi:hypothetical protein HanIR_Chr05g0255281 [Helianthus annuus]|nr:hypothetical protein HanIR_Chr05g0255281 [Helianthus annuus]